MSDANTGRQSRPLEALVGWQPIRTAPKDGEALLVWGGSGYWIAAWRLPMTYEPQAETHYKHEWRDGSGRWASPTHWMHLPLPPNAYSYPKNAE